MVNWKYKNYDIKYLYNLKGNNMGYFNKLFVSQKLIDALLGEPLYNDFLLPDINKGIIFPAIRSNAFNFYFNGGNLLRYDIKNNFTTHIKYLPIIDYLKDNSYFNEEKINKILHLYKLSFVNDKTYQRMKENCKLFAGEEAKGVAHIIKKGDAFKKDIIPLDIEISFKSISGNSFDRLDFLLFNKEQQRLKFFEVKHLSNNEIRSKISNVPKVICQIERYQKQILKNKNDIIGAYNNYIININNIFNLKMPNIVDLEDKVTLIIFGYDREQEKKVKAWKNIHCSSKGIQCYTKGHIDGKYELSILWNAK